jgi:hypothetical protein
MAAALLLAACGAEGIDDQPASRVAPEGTTGVRTINLTEDDAAYVVDVEGGRTDDGLDVIGRDGARTPASDWLRETSHGIQLDIARYDGPVAIFTGVERVLDMSEYDDRAVGVFEEARGQGSCPPTCMHCPEQAVALCASMCGFR